MNLSTKILIILSIIVGFIMAFSDGFKGFDSILLFLILTVLAFISLKFAIFVLKWFFNQTGR